MHVSPSEREHASGRDSCDGAAVKDGVPRATAGTRTPLARFLESIHEDEQSNQRSNANLTFVQWFPMQIRRSSHKAVPHELIPIGDGRPLNSWHHKMNQIGENRTHYFLHARDCKVALAFAPTVACGSASSSVHPTLSAAPTAPQCCSSSSQPGLVQLAHSTQNYRGTSCVLKTTSIVQIALALGIAIDTLRRVRRHYYSAQLGYTPPPRQATPPLSACPALAPAGARRSAEGGAAALARAPPREVH
eukprot:gene25846-biopygen10548